MPRKFLDIRFTDYPIPAEKGGNCALFLLPARDLGQGTGPMQVFRAAP